MIVTLARLVAYLNDPGGYINYIFEVLDEDEIKRLDTKYIVCTRFPNWECKEIKLYDEGYLSVKEIIAGEDKWFDGKTFRPYHYTMVQFLKFIDKPKEVKHEYRL